jgi:hypothetical protein
MDLPPLPQISPLIRTLKDYPDERKKWLNFIGFIGVIASLFLQVNLASDDPAIKYLRAVQAFFLVIFWVLLLGLFLDFKKRLLLNFENIIWRFAINLFTITIGFVFFYNLSALIIIKFGGSLMQYWFWLKYPFLLLLVLILGPFDSWLREKPDTSVKKTIRGAYSALWAFQASIWLLFIDLFILPFLVVMQAGPTGPIVWVSPTSWVSISTLIIAQLVTILYFCPFKKTKKFFSRYITAIIVFVLLLNNVILPFLSRFV